MLYRIIVNRCGLHLFEWVVDFRVEDSNKNLWLAIASAFPMPFQFVKSFFGEGS